MSNKSKGEANKKAIGIRLDKEVLDLLAEASTTAGVSRTEIIEESFLLVPVTLDNRSTS